MRDYVPPKVCCPRMEKEGVQLIGGMLWGDKVLWDIWYWTTAIGIMVVGTIRFCPWCAKELEIGTTDT